MVGTLFFGDKSLTCFYGEKTSAIHLQTKEEKSADINSKISYFAEEQSTEKSFLQQGKNDLSYNAQLLDKKYEDMQNLVEYVNNN